MDMFKRTMVPVKKALEDAKIAKSDIAVMQPYQDQRRRKVAARILAYNLYKRRSSVNFVNLNLYSNLRKESARAVLKEFLGTAKRLYKKKK